MVDADPVSMIARLSIPLGVITSIVGGSAWLTTTANRVDNVSQELSELKSEYRSQKDKILDRLQYQDGKLSEVNSRLSGMDAKLDLVISAIKKKD